MDAVCVTQITSHIFEMVNAVADKNQRKALDLYYELLALKEPPMRILFLLTREYRILFHVKALLKQGYGRRRSLQKRAPSFCCGEIYGSGETVPLKELRAAMEEGADIEQRVKRDF